MATIRRNHQYHQIDERIVKSYIKLASTMDSSKIGVVELWHAANVNRSTFYNHYKGTWEIRNKITDGIIKEIDEIFDSFDYKTFYEEPEKIFNQINIRVNDHIEYLRSLLMVTNAEYFVHHLLKSLWEKTLANDKNGFPEHIRNSAIGQINSAYFIAGIISVYCGYISGRLQCSSDDITKILSKTIKYTQSEEFLK